MQQTCFFAATYCLLDYYTGVQNVLEGMAIAGKRRDLDSAYEILEKMGIRRDTADQNVKELSGGQKQRVAIARAVACQARIILADEPTGTLDEDTAGEIIELFQKLAHEEGICVIVVTHMRMLAEKADDVIRLENKSFFYLLKGAGEQDNLRTIYGNFPTIFQQNYTTSYMRKTLIIGDGFFILILIRRLLFRRYVRDEGGILSVRKQEQRKPRMQE